MIVYVCGQVEVESGHVAPPGPLSSRTQLVSKLIVEYMHCEGEWFMVKLTKQPEHWKILHPGSLQWIKALFFSNVLLKFNLCILRNKYMQWVYKYMAAHTFWADIPMLSE